MQSDAHTRFTTDLSDAKTQHAAYEALFQLSDAIVPVRLWTVMSLDPKSNLARRVYTNMPEAYPASGTKPMTENAWSEIVRNQHKCFTANTLAEIAEVFPDHALIGSLGCGSVLNLPITHDRQLVGTVNLLDVEHHFTPERIQICQTELAEPARTTMLKARDLPEE
jgi:hypothetical protein